MWKTVKKGFKDAGKQIKQGVGDLLDAVDDVVTNAVIEAKRPETEEPIKNVVDELNRVLNKLKVNEPYTGKDPAIRAAIQMRSQLGDALRELDKDLGKLNARAPLLEYNTQWNNAVNKFNQASAEVIRSYRSDITNAPWNGWTPLKKFANLFIALYNALPGEGKIEPYTFDKTQVTLASQNNIKGQLDTLKQEMVDSEPSMRPKQ
ncbi:hypothetical protein Lwal_1287 [Legionella waltersii]|uniref:Uncharacterized protein n=2 Tax=Legionella waltersii TaxID=66969 RepID=A0A0W1ACX6_9GAMM|nr:hypothetical protein [Legionella waltersii]KTD79215.1 hypothetical protein Lwal_1287 [Legionella waltersii]SNV12560.1 Uncharacterised protein [Legionella waltersii]